MLISGAMSSPFAVASLFFVPEYWDPARLFDAIIGIEDIIFSFSNGGIVWMLSVWSLKNKLLIILKPYRIIVRSALCLLLWISTTYVFIFLGTGIMASVFLSLMLLELMLILLRYDLWIISLSGAIRFSLLYFIFIKVCFIIWPEFIAQWNTEKLWGITFMDIPIEEILWGVGFGAVWPLCLAYVLDVKIKVPPENISMATTQFSNPMA